MYRKIILSSLVIAGSIAFGAFSASAQDCKNGICISQSSRWDAQRKKSIRTFSVSGYPRTKQDYVTNFYQIRGLPHGTHAGKQYEGKGGPFEFTSTLNVSVQACRRTGTLIRNTYCTKWETFTIY